MRKFRIKVTGDTALIMHNGRLANPMDKATKEVSDTHKAYSKNKTDRSFNALARAEFIGSLYYLEQGETVIGPVWPTDNLFSALKNAAKKIKRGRGSLKEPRRRRDHVGRAGRQPAHLCRVQYPRHGDAAQRRGVVEERGELPVPESGARRRSQGSAHPSDLQVVEVRGVRDA